MRGGKEISITSPFILDPLFSASGFLARYTCFNTASSSGSFTVAVFDNEKKRIFNLELTRKEDGEKVYLFVEKVAGFLEALSGIPYSEVRLGREIGLFEEALSLSNDLIGTLGERGTEKREGLLKGWWSLPSGALVLALSGGSALLSGTEISRFPAEINLARELHRLLRVMQSLRMEGPMFGLPPICYLGEMIKCYMDLSAVERKDCS